MAHGKSTVVKAISGVHTVRFKNELERNITIKLGYANAKVRECIFSDVCVIFAYFWTSMFEIKEQWKFVRSGFTLSNVSFPVYRLQIQTFNFIVNPNCFHREQCICINVCDKRKPVRMLIVGPSFSRLGVIKAIYLKV